MKREALSFSLQAGAAGNAVRAREQAERSHIVKRYLSLLTRALEAQWYEGHALAHLADLVWLDPLLLSPRDSRILSTLQTRADREASQAASLAGSAALWRRLHRRSFRYQPVFQHG
jgi:hypothetical protein